MQLFSKHEHDANLNEEDPESIEEEYISNAVIINKLFEKLKSGDKVEYLEAWRKDYLERINKIIDWSFQDTKNYSDVVTMLFKFEEFFTTMMMLVGQAEAMRRSYKTIQKRAKVAEGSHPEIG